VRERLRGRAVEEMEVFTVRAFVEVVVDRAVVEVVENHPVVTRRSALVLKSIRPSDPQNVTRRV
jgi:hypothetical protein